jgi:hypothetical protein
MTWGAADGAERGLYADFLLEAAQILNKPALKDASEKFRESHRSWLAFADALLPDEIPLLGESKKLIQQKHHLFIRDGESALTEIQEINAKLNQLLSQSESDFPLSEAQAADLRENLRDILLTISRIERQAVNSLQSAIL